MNHFFKLCLLILPLSLMAEKASVEQLFSVQTVKVKSEKRSERIKNYGYVKADESRMYDVSPRFGGYVIKLYADTIYKRVKKGDPLVTVYSPEVFKAKDEYLNAYRYTRKRPNKGMLSSAKLKLQLLGLQEDEINKVIKKGRASANTTIYSPVDGYVFVKEIDKGSAFNAKQKLFRIVNLDKVWVEAKLFEEERAGLSSISKYVLNFKGLKKTYATQKKLLYPELNPKEATLTLRLSLNNAEHKLFPGMYATVLSIKSEKVQLVLPSTAVIRKNGKHYVFMVGEYEGEYEPKEVGIRVLDANTYAVTDGLQEGDEVVNNALFMMDSDAQINSLY
jgi:Cu(I)/Ag(I) efflux system membrane fusion protein